MFGMDCEPVEFLGNEGISCFPFKGTTCENPGNLYGNRVIRGTAGVGSRAERSYLPDARTTDCSGIEDFSGNDRIVSIVDKRLCNNSETVI